MIMKMARHAMIAAIVIMSGASWGNAAVPVSPKNVTDLSCPTFSWSLEEGSLSYRIEVYEQQTTDLLEHQVISSISTPVRTREIAAPALAWTPSSDECLARGVRYVWYVRGANSEGEGHWSEGAGFQVEASALTVEQMDAVQEVIKKYLASDTGKAALSDALKSNAASVAAITQSNILDNKNPGAKKVAGISQASISTPAFTIDQNNFIGLGTSTPQFPLDSRIYRGSTFARFGVLAAPLFMIAGGAPQIGFNLYQEAGYKYGDSWYGGYLAFNQEAVGGFSLGTAPFGTLDTPATPVTRMVVTNDGLVGIGKTSPSYLLDVAGSLNAGPATFADNSTNGTGVDGRANVGSNAWGVYGSSGEGIGVMGRSGSPTGFAGRFENLSTGKAIGASVNGVEVLTVDTSGVHAGPGMTPTPIAHGVFAGSDGSRVSGSSNINCTWNATWLRYDCTITGENYYYTSYTANVTLLSPTAAVPVVGSSSGQLLVTFYDFTGTKIKPANGFSVSIFKQ